MPQVSIFIEFIDELATDYDITFIVGLVAHPFRFRKIFQSDFHGYFIKWFYFGLQFLDVLGKENTVVGEE